MRISDSEYYDAQFRIRDAVPEFDHYVSRYRALSAATRRHSHVIECAYGSSPLERVDAFLPPTVEVDRPVHIFIHGGYWRAFDKTDYAYIAEPIVDEGAVAVIANYGLMPAVSMSELLRQARAMVRWVHANAADLGASPQRISVSGHSAGGHIAMSLALTDWEKEDLPPDIVKSTLAVSGIFDLQPVLDSFLREEIQLTPEDVARFSPINALTEDAAYRGQVVLAVGAEETAEFQRQSVAFAQALRRCGMHVALRLISGRHHMNIVLDLGDSSSELGRLLIDTVLAAGAR